MKTAAEAVCLGLMDGRRTWESLGELLERALGVDARRVPRALSRRLAPLFVDGDGSAVPFGLEVLAAVKSPDPRAGLRPLPGPRVLHWWVTSYCPRRCAYCFARPLHGFEAPDAVVTRSTLRRVFREAASLGAEYLLVQVGEGSGR